MNNSEAQMRAIKLSSSQNGEDRGRMSEDGDNRVHVCPACGHEMPMNEVVARAGAERLTHSDEEEEDREHMDEEKR